MCGRYTIAKAEAAREALIERLGLKIAEEIKLPTRYNVAPTQIMPVVCGDQVVAMRWGVTRTIDGQPKLVINARSETAATKFSFRENVARRRCLIIADGFFEWHRTNNGKTKTPFLFRVRGGEPFFMAGIYDEATADAPLTYIPLTTTPNKVMEAIHDRQPVILDDVASKIWLREGELTAEQYGVIRQPIHDEELTAIEVSPTVNSARNDDSTCIEPAKSSSFDGELF